ncbi:MAG: hypothetical protein CME64_08230 [Halobacteriovoraceae bacterium]|nr:hypothetical protein [Halobacteriovoraceae bacterium]|tara:strand:+ start:191314 stop:192648 length:1335 start_codon:yes stop_codon:yes gene_type:complete
MKPNKSLLFLIPLVTFAIGCGKKNGGGKGATSLDDIDTALNTPAVVAEEPDFSQGFDSFDFDGKSTLASFGLFGRSDKQEYINDGKIKFDLLWSKRTRNFIADQLGRDRSEMNHNLTNQLCEPRLEIHKDNESKVAELDSALSHCGIDGDVPAQVQMRSFIPTTIGHKYTLSFKYKMKSFEDMDNKSYRHLLVRFGKFKQKYDPAFDEYIKVDVEIVATSKHTKLAFADNGKADGHGVFLDDIQVKDLGEVEHYGACLNNFKLNSKGFKKCVNGEIASDVACSFDNPADAVVRYKEGKNVSSRRANVDNMFTVEDPKRGKINFLSLGLGGHVRVKCGIEKTPALFDVYEKTLSFGEVSWGNVSMSNYPEVAVVKIKLQNCVDESLNRTIKLANVGTAEFFEYSFTQDEEGRSFEGCKMSNLTIKDITPSGPSYDGFDVNSFEFY